MSITFKDLENFLMTAQSKTLSEASLRLDMAQPSLSLGMKKLEGELGHTLFIRGRDGIKLTPQGKLLLPEAIEALRILEKIKGKEKVLKFKIGCHPSVGMFVLGDFLKIMHGENARLNFEVVNASSHEVNKMVSQGVVDFGIVMNPLQVQGLITRPIGDDHVRVWESRSRYQNKLIFNPHMLQARSIISRWDEAPGETVEVENLELISHLTHSGSGVGILPTQVVKTQRLKLQIVRRTPSFKDHLALVCYPEMIRSQEGKMIFEALKKSFK